MSHRGLKRLRCDTVHWLTNARDRSNLFTARLLPGRIIDIQDPLTSGGGMLFHSIHIVWFAVDSIAGDWALDHVRRLGISDASTFGVDPIHATEPRRECRKPLGRSAVVLGGSGSLVPKLLVPACKLVASTFLKVHRVSLVGADHLCRSVTY